MSEPCSEAGEQLYHEIHALIRRHQNESDVTGYQIIGALEAAKLDVLEGIRRANEGES